MTSSNVSSICRIDWRPSRGLCAGLIGLGGLAGLAILLSDVDVRLAWSAALLCVASSLHGALGEWRRPEIRIIWVGGSEPALIASGEARWELQSVSLHLRGPLAVLAGRDGHGQGHRWVFYPDTLDGAGCRSLRLLDSRCSTRPDTLAVALS
ncbi:MAG TPA: hypothetical protein VFY12_13125 [Arenimonas sp.]|nr:hypothetical protein [Arenimonas sp.]